MKKSQLRKWAIMALLTTFCFQVSAQKPKLSDSTIVVKKSIKVVNGDTIFNQETTVNYQPKIEITEVYSKILDEVFFSFGQSEKKINKETDRQLKTTSKALSKTVKTLNKYARTDISGNPRQIKQLLSELGIYIGGRNFKNYEYSTAFQESFTPESLKETADFLSNLNTEFIKIRKSKADNKLIELFKTIKSSNDRVKTPIKNLKLLEAFAKEYSAWLTKYMSKNIHRTGKYTYGSTQPLSSYKDEQQLESERLEKEHKERKERKERDRKIFDNAYTLSPEQVKVSEIPYRGGNDCKLVCIEPLTDVTKVTIAIPIHFESNWFSTTSDYIEDAATGDRYYARSVERGIPLDRIIIIKDNARTMTEITTLYPPLKEGVKFIRIKSSDKSNVEIPSNAAEDTDYGLIFIDDYNPALKDKKKEIKEYR